MPESTTVSITPMNATAMRFILTTLSLLSAIALQTVQCTTDYVLKESHPVPHGWSWTGEAESSHTIRLQLVLRRHRFEELERHLFEVSDPEHVRYGQHLSREEANELSGPSPQTLGDVLQWLEQYVDLGSAQTEFTASGNTLSVSLTVAQAEAVLDTEFGVYRHDDGSKLIRAPEWKLPRHLHDHVSTVQPTTSFIRSVRPIESWSGGEAHDHALLGSRDASRDLSVKQACNTSAITPLCLRTLYGTISYEPQATDINRLGLTNFRNQVNNRSDIGIFLEKYRPEAVSSAQDFGLVSVNGGTLQQTPLNETQLKILLGGEGDLDVEYLLSLAWPTPLTSWSVAGAPPFIPDADSKPYSAIEPYLTWLDYVLQLDDIPQVISNSYADDEQTVPPAYAHAVCAKFAQLAARGVTFLTGSGDGGVGGTQPGGSCLSNRDNETVQFIPQFPATCPYVTVVGGTSGIPEVAGFDPKNGYASGAGFSNYFPRPHFQNKTVAAYLEEIGDSFAGLYNVSGRAYPDIAAYSTKYVQIWNGTQLIIDGTSAATPTMAAVISLVNDALLAAGRPVIGWMNPWLYKHGGKGGFSDVTSGSSSGCNTTGFPATEGWDAVTGFGTPRFEKLLKAAGLEPKNCKGYRGAS